MKCYIPYEWEPGKRERDRKRKREGEKRSKGCTHWSNSKSKHSIICWNLGVNQLITLLDSTVFYCNQSLSRAQNSFIISNRSW